MILITGWKYSIKWDFWGVYGTFFHDGVLVEYIHKTAHATHVLPCVLLGPGLLAKLTVGDAIHMSWAAHKPDAQNGNHVPSPLL